MLTQPFINILEILSKITFIAFVTVYLYTASEILFVGVRDFKTENGNIFI